MIVFELSCEQGHAFEGWFRSSGDFVAQQEKGLLACPQCGSGAIHKAPMAPAVPRKGNQIVERAAADRAERPLFNAPMPPQVAAAIEQLAKAQAEALKNSTWVGKGFAEQSRAMHYGEREQAAIHGEASVDEARELLEEGVPIAPLPLPVAPPEELN
ncbi:MAG: hypothetical protein B7Y88_01955 [Sphingomonadales bacterium 32-64-17]|nr:MAG: hypothetical protein B7Y88_01955 [Sphingomonadales bacterium 32-64-17]